jgi:hypothetical protein
MTVETLLQEVKTLPMEERARLFEELHRLEDASVPESFWRGLADCQSGRVMEMDEALENPPARQS